MMLEPLRHRAAKREVSVVRAVPAPTLGWISQDNITLGRPGTALKLDNWFPFAESVDLRGGFKVHSTTSVATTVDTVMPYHAQDGSTKQFCVSSGTIFDTTSSSASATTITGLDSDRMEWINFVNAGNTYLWACNGVDNPVHYNGTVWATPSITGLTNPASTDIIGVNEFKGRIYFVFKNSLKFGYFTSPGAIAGAASTFELGSQFSKGGYLVAMATWTRDGGSGADDYAVWITSEGQAIVYQGSDPSDPNNWNRVGVYNLPRPIGRRCLIEAGDDVIIITESGLIPLSKSFNVDSAAIDTVSVSKNIQAAMNSAAKLYADNFGWQLATYPLGTMAILNVPLSEGKIQHQYVMNTVTGAWARFTGINASCWTLVGKRLFFGGNDGKVYEYGVNSSDNGRDIISDMKLAFTTFKDPSHTKDWKLIQPVLITSGSITPSIGLNVDFSDELPTGLVVGAQFGGLFLDNFNLNDEVLPGNNTIINNWVSVSARPGRAAAVRMKVTANVLTGSVVMKVLNFNVMFERGAISG